MTNALMTDSLGASFLKEFLKRDYERGVVKASVATRAPEEYADLNFVSAYKYIGGDSDKEDVCGERLYLSSVELGYSVIDAVIESVLGKGAKLIARASADLDEVGRCDVKYNLSPVMLLHKLGLLDGNSVAGGIYLDNDDVDLMVQCGASLILLPSLDIAGGRGIPNLVSYLDRGLKVSVGCGERGFGLSLGLEAEGLLLAAAVNGAMARPDAVTLETVKTLLK